MEISAVVYLRYFPGNLWIIQTFTSRLIWIRYFLASVCFGFFFFFFYKKNKLSYKSAQYFTHRVCGGTLWGSMEASCVLCGPNRSVCQVLGAAMLATKPRSSRFRQTKWFQLKLHVLFTEAGVTQVKHGGTLDHSDPNLVRITVRSSWLSLLWYLEYSLGMSSWMWNTGRVHSSGSFTQSEEDWLEGWHRIWIGAYINDKGGNREFFLSPGRDVTSDGRRRKVISVRGQRKEKINKEVCSAWGKTYTILSNGTYRCSGRIP